jgi:acyl-[acyl-carrier-protein] desaturase
MTELCDDPTQPSGRAVRCPTWLSTYRPPPRLRSPPSAPTEADGIPWDQVKVRAVDEDLVEILEAFYSVEMYLPDYSAKLIALNRENHGMAWFFTNWCYEESKHSMAIEEWLIRSGRRTPAQMELLNHRLLSVEWTLPFDTSRRMLIYSMFQELATQLNYVNLSKLTAPAGDQAAAITACSSTACASF